MINHDPEAMRDTMNYIETEWPTITDVHGCAKFVLRNEHDRPIDALCSFWLRHNPCF